MTRPCGFATITRLKESISDFSHGASLPADSTPAILSWVGSSAAACWSGRQVVAAQAARPATADRMIGCFDIDSSLWLSFGAVQKAALIGSNTLRLTQSIAPRSVIA